MRWIVIATALLVSACSSQPLYDELGGRHGLEQIAGRFIANVGEDPSIRPYFENTNLDRFHEMFTSHLCAVIHGPCVYQGDDMAATHIGMNIPEADFNRVVELLGDAMDDEGIPQRAQNRLLKQLARFRTDIIYR